ncbi:GNAT family N-acetyltransferase [Candidatus Gottesmanbacteria bacterium]|nr:GNAT family N-acetyltransferase [Candidatus Gottesmanbacteria bacterium]
MSITIENATMWDIPMMLRWGRNTPDLWGDDSGEWYEEKDLVDWIQNPRDDFILVARDEKKLVGMCFVYQMRGWAYCDVLYVDLPYRGKGIGTRFLIEVEKRIKDKNISFGFFVKQDNDSAQSFYIKRAFQYGYKLFWMFKKLK